MLGSKFKFLLISGLILAGLSLSAGETELRRKLAEARALIQMRQFNEAAAEIDAVLRTSPAMIEAEMVRMDLWRVSGKTNELNAFLQAKNAQKDKASAKVVLGYDQIMTKQYTQAEQMAGNAIKQEGNNYLAWYVRGYANFYQKNWDAAINDMLKVTQLQPDFSEPYYLLGQLYKFKNDQTKMIQYWETYLTKIPPKGPVYIQVHGTLSKLKGG